MWLDNLKELKKKTGMSSKLIADKTNLPERTVSRIFSGDTDAPRVDTLRRIVAVLGGSLDDLFVESGSVVANTGILALQAEVDRLTEENGILSSSLNIANLDLAVLKEKVAALESENKLLCLKLEYEEKLVSVHNFYNKLNQNN